MQQREKPRWLARDTLARALVGGYVAGAALLVAYLLEYALAVAVAGLDARQTPSAQQIQSWHRAILAHPLTSLGGTTLYALLAAQFVLAIVGGVAYAALERSWDGPEWLRGLRLGLPLWLLLVVVLMPLVGAGLFGVQLGAGPLPLLGSLAAFLAYGIVLGVAYGTTADRLLGPVTTEEIEALDRSARTGAVGIGIGLTAGVGFGIAVAWLGLTPAPAVAQVLAIGVAGGAIGGVAGPLVGLSGGAGRASGRQRSPQGRSAPAEPNAPPRLRVVAASGACVRGYKVGDTFLCAPSGQVGPELCPAATHALQPLVAAMAQGRAGAPQRVACPIYDHMLVFELEGVAATAPAVA